MDDMPARRPRLIDRMTLRPRDPHRSDEWLGGEAHVRFQRARSWRDLLQRHGTGTAGVALAFLVGIAVGSGMTIFARVRR